MDFVVSQATTRQDEAATKHVWLRPRRLLVLFDAVSMAVTFVCLHFFLVWRGVLPATVSSTYIGVGIFVFVTLVLSSRDGQYSVGYRMSRLADAGNLLKNLLLGLAAAALLFFATKGFFTGSPLPSRLVTSGAVLVFVFLTVTARLALAGYQRSLFEKGKQTQNVLIFGSGKMSEDLLTLIGNRPWLGVRCAGRLVYGTPEREGSPARLDAVCITDTMEGLENLHRAMRAAGASTVLVALDEDEYGVLPHINRLLTLAHVQYKVMPSLFEHAYAASSRLGYADLPSVVQLRVDPLDRAQLMFKRALDVSCTLAGTALILPVLTVLAVAIKVDSRGPLFYKQERVGRDGRPFDMYKFRSMVVNAEELLQGLEAQNEAAATNGLMFKMKADPRVTRVGRFMRKWSLDELPQLRNVLRGEMSLVGPRPPLPREVEKYEPEHLVRLKGVPGLTGLWQVSGRSELSFEEMVRLDKYYLENWSLGLDLSILVKTVVVVLTGKGAY